jgi:hypothetical protein
VSCSIKPEGDVLLASPFSLENLPPKEQAVTHIPHRRLALLLSMVTVALMAGCGSIYRPSKEAVKQWKPDEGYADFMYVHLAKVWPEDKMNLRKGCEKNKADGKPVLKVCDNPDDYVAVQYTVGRFAGSVIVVSRPLLIQKSFNPEPGMIIKKNLRFGPDAVVLDVRKPTEDCKWVGPRDHVLDTFESQARNNIERATGAIMGLIPVIAIPTLIYVESEYKTETAGIVCDGWDYREAYKTWIATYRDL